MHPEEHEVFISVVVVQRPPRGASRLGLDDGSTFHRQRVVQTLAMPHPKRQARVDRTGWVWFGLGLVCCFGSVLSFYLLLQTY